MSDSLARRERLALCDTAVSVGEEAATCCEGWDAKDLLTHLLLRERAPLAAVADLVPGRSGAVARRQAALRRQPMEALADRLRDPQGTLFALPVVDRLANTLEMFVHHEDLRRAQPGWRPRVLADVDEQTLWGQLRLAGRLLARPLGVPVVMAWPERGERSTLVKGPQPVTLTGRPSELTLLLFGRPAEDVGLDGHPDALKRFHQRRDRL